MEKKEKNEKVVSMNTAENASKKLSYEELERVANGLNAKCGQMYQQLQEANNIISSFNETELLLSILDKAEYFHEPFVQRCVEQIENVVGKALDEYDKQVSEEEK